MTEKLKGIVSEAGNHGLTGIEALAAAAHAYHEEMGQKVAERSVGSRYVEALLVLNAYGQSGVPRSFVDVVLGAKTGKVTQDAVDEARRTISELALPLEVSEFSPWTPEMPEYQDGLKELLGSQVEDARKRVEERADVLRNCRVGMRRGTAPSTNADKTRECVPTHRECTSSSLVF